MIVFKIDNTAKAPVWDLGLQSNICAHKNANKQHLSAYSRFQSDKFSITILLYTMSNCFVFDETTKFSLRRAVTVKQRCSFVIKIRRSFRFWCILKIIVLKYKNHFLRCLLKEKFWKDLTFSVDSKL